MWTVWWVWMVAGLVLGVLEILAPGFIFLGFAIGALLTGVLLVVGVLGGSVPVLLESFVAVEVPSFPTPAAAKLLSSMSTPRAAAVFASAAAKMSADAETISFKVMEHPPGISLRKEDDPSASQYRSGHAMVRVTCL